MKRRTVTSNRRQVKAGSQHLLDVRVRRSTAKRQRRHRVVRTVFTFIVWISLAVGTGFGFHEIVNKFFLKNPEYNLRVVDTDLDGLMTPAEAMKIAGIQTGKNIFRIDLGAAEHALRQIDQINKVTIERDWPDRVSIKITKRIPIAWLARAGTEEDSHSLLLDAQGATIKPYRVEPEYWHLPVIFAPNPELIQKHDLLATADLQAALDLLAARSKKSDSVLSIVSMDISKGYAIEVVDADKAHITFAPEQPAAQLDRLQKLLLNCRETNRKLESVNLIPKKYTPVRFLLALNAAEPVAEPTPKPKGKR
ncbi:MAG: cell division protein FtsQ/DivIB [Chthoniobacterales bacterium]